MQSSPDKTGVSGSSPEWPTTSFKDNTILKLFLNADPGSILAGAQREFCRSWPNQAEVTVKGIHFIQEDSPSEIGQTIADFLKRIINVEVS